MPLKKKYNARFPAARIKKIMQTDEEVGKVAQAVPVIISRTLELFVESLLKKTLEVTNSRNARTLTPSHLKQCIMTESRFDFLADLVKNVPDAVNEEDTSQSNEMPSSSSINNTNRRISQDNTNTQHQSSERNSTTSVQSSRPLNHITSSEPPPLVWNNNHRLTANHTPNNNNNNTQSISNNSFSHSSTNHNSNSKHYQLANIQPNHAPCLSQQIPMSVQTHGAQTHAQSPSIGIPSNNNSTPDYVEPIKIEINNTNSGFKINFLPISSTGSTLNMPNSTNVPSFVPNTPNHLPGSPASNLIIDEDYDN